MLSALGNGEVTNSNLSTTLDKIYSEFKKKFKRNPIDVSLSIEDTLAYGLDYGFTSIDTDFLESIDSLKELILPNSITEIKMTPKLETILKENRVLIRGSFDSFAEEFAIMNKLHFRPADFVFASHLFEYAHETTVLTMQFKRNGKVVIEVAVNSPGSSGGNTFGGNFYHNIPNNFYKTKTVEEIAGSFSDVTCKAILENGSLATFIEKAKTHKFFMGKN